MKPHNPYEMFHIFMMRFSTRPEAILLIEFNQERMIARMRLPTFLRDEVILRTELVMKTGEM
jgi:hypothetical protein